MFDSKQFPHVFSDAHPFSGQFQRELNAVIMRAPHAPAPSPPAPPVARQDGAVSPAIDIHETGEALVMTAELPGLGEEDIEITLKDRTLTLRGKKRMPQTGAGDMRFCERSYGSFARAIALPDTVATDLISAVFDRGVLHVTLPKRAPQTPLCKTRGARR